MARDNEVANIIKALSGLRDLASWNLEGAVNSAREIARRLGTESDAGLDTQVYKFLSSIRRIEMAVERAASENEREMVIATNIPMLRPRLAYAASRKKELYVVYEVLNEAIPKVKKVADFKRLLQFIEAIVAYQRFNQKFSAQRAQSEGRR